MLVAEAVVRLLVAHGGDTGSVLLFRGGLPDDCEHSDTSRAARIRHRTSGRWYSEKLGLEPVDFGEMGATVDGVITTPDGQKAAWFKDSEGNTFALSMAD